MDMNKDLFAEHPFGKVALHLLAPVHADFRLCEAERLQNDCNIKSGIMRVTGHQFRKSLAGPTKGQLTVIVPGTKRTVYVTTHDITEFMTKHGGE
jgi:hypothetical protein